MTRLCLDCRLVSDELADGRYCVRCRSGVLRAVTPKPRNAGATLTEGNQETSDDSWHP